MSALWYSAFSPQVIAINPGGQWSLRKKINMDTAHTKVSVLSFYGLYHITTYKHIEKCFALVIPSILNNS